MITGSLVVGHDPGDDLGAVGGGRPPERDDPWSQRTLETDLDDDPHVREIADEPDLFD